MSAVNMFETYTAMILPLSHRQNRSSITFARLVKIAKNTIKPNMSFSISIGLLKNAIAILPGVALAIPGSLKKRAGAGVMSAKLFGAFVGGMTSNLSDFDQIKNIGTSFKDVFSNKDKNYPYSQEYFEMMKDKAVKKLNDAWDIVVHKMRGTNLDSSSGSEAVRQARLNIDSKIQKSKEIKLRN